MAVPKDVICSAKKLVMSGKIDEAQNLLLDEGYVKRLELTIQKAYLQLIPIGSTLHDMLEEVYKGLDDSHQNIRFKALTQLTREFAQACPRNNVRWMRDPRASEPIIKAALDPNRKIFDRALIALSTLVCKYFPDQQALTVFQLRLTDPKQETRNRAISGIACLRREEALRHLVDLIDCGTDQDRAEVVRQIWGLFDETLESMNQYPIEWSEAGCRFWRDKIVAALHDSHVLVRKHAARALKSLGDRTTLPALHAARDTEYDEDTAFYIDDTIVALKERP
ncbi:MAG: HEAT repeat domain-containing protein [Nitrospirales bacterium]